MNKTIHALTVALGAFLLLPVEAFATNTPGADCVGHQACTTNSNNTTVNNNQRHISQSQAQSQAQSAYSQAHGGAAGAMAQGGSTNVSVDNGSGRSWSIHPVTVIAPPALTPSANISRMVSMECGPRQRVISFPVNGVNNRTMSEQEVALGVDQELEPEPQAYRKVELAPGLYQLLGHRVIETSAVITASTNAGFAMAGNGGSGAGGSVGFNSSGALQRVVNTIRLQECVVATIDERPKAITPPAPKKRPAGPSRKPKAHPRKPEC